MADQRELKTGRRRMWYYVAAYLVAAAIGTAIDAIFHLYIAAFVALLPTIWVFVDREKRVQDDRRNGKG